MRNNPTLTISFIPSTTYVNDTSGKPKLSVTISNYLSLLQANFSYQIFQEVGGSNISITPQLSTSTLTAIWDNIFSPPRFEIVLPPVFTMAGNYSAQVLAKKLNGQNINSWSTNKMIIKSYDEFTSFDNLRKLSLVDLEQASTNSLLYALTSKNKNYWTH
ncbi:hypothetical protein FDP41_002216 [Naegleria fowleri]|uniref:Uncharacterized protein n=1 Tax=Naegleria fowleri TaxID=5763 RepID=A0A6A5BV55_NAEFO|nr:uncharacterized protein FDP41_002216 [Naegleria fowleri]KAF0979146.1 hypothetical protein FDP41_002216 [Naegleria fowleri]